MTIPKTIWTIWLNDDGRIPENIQKCIDTHRIRGYKHNLITLDTCYKNKYVRDCIRVGKYAKAADFLRIYYLYHQGGIYLDADVQVLEEKNFNRFLENQLFCGREENGFISNAIIGAEKGHPMLQDYLQTVISNFIGSGDLVFQPGMYLWTEKCTYPKRDDIKVYDSDFFLPFNWQKNTTILTPNTVCIHFFNKSWL